MTITFRLLASALILGVLTPIGSAADKQPHVVFVTGDEEYRSEESMPFLAKLLEKHHGFRCTVCYALADDGTINPSRLDNIAGLEALKSADLMVMFTRFRSLPNDQLKLILDYVDSGRPMVGFRTTTHAFLYKDGPQARWNGDFGKTVFGQQWITHHGHHGHQYLTDVKPLAARADHPILRGVKPFKCYSWLYHVDGGKQKLYGDCTPLLEGTSLVSGHQKANKLDEYPLTQPVAWTKSYTGTGGKTARVFFTTLGHPHDFEAEAMRKVALNGIFWALGRDKDIPADGVKVDLLGDFKLTNAGFGGHVKGVKPSQR